LVRLEELEVRDKKTKIKKGRGETLVIYEYSIYEHKRSGESNKMEIFKGASKIKRNQNALYTGN